MTLSLSSLLVVVVCGALTDAAPRTNYDVSDVRGFGFPLLSGYRHPYHPYLGLHPGTDDYLGTRGDYPESSLHGSMIEDLQRQILDVQRRYHDDLLMLRRRIEELGLPPRTSTLDMPWFYPAFPYPYAPKDVGSLEEEEEEKKDKKKKHLKDESVEDEDDAVVDYDNAEDIVVSLVSPDGGDLDSIFEDSPKPGDEWTVIPLLPEVPDADDLPDKYDNSTHTVHIINGSRVEVNTTTHKDSGDVVTTFYHTEVINILPDETGAEEEEDTTELPAFDGEEGVIEVSEGENETLPEVGTLAIPAGLEELIKEVKSKGMPKAARTITTTTTTVTTRNNNGFRFAREATEDHSTAPTQSPSQTSPSPTPAGPQTQHLAAYVKGKGKGEGKGDVAPPRDLSGDTLVNILPGGKKGGKETEPDAEIITSSEELH